MNKIPIIYFHSVAPQKNKNWLRSYLTIELKYFIDLIKYLKFRNYKGIFLKDYFELKNNQPNSNEKFVCITFDDGYLDNFIYVYPVLKKYGFKFTIFVSPEYVDKREIIRSNLFDYQNNKCSLNDINQWGFLSWEEMREMEKSGFGDIQSHTYTHNKYFVSDEIIGYHSCRNASLNTIAAMYPEKKFDYIEDKDFIKLIPGGYPLFKEASSVIAKRVYINNDFIKEILRIFNESDIGRKEYNFSEYLDLIKNIYRYYKDNNIIINKVETEKEYLARVYDELFLSKKEIDFNLGKDVKYCCWPHGDYNQFSHLAAINSGYDATNIVEPYINISSPDRYSRVGFSVLKNNRLLTLSKTVFNFHYYLMDNPFFYLKNILYKFR